ncbi:hypothetical protein DL96DRAFT_1671996 [Flagelloscypha sp. PMI_526]|nr:hypothetical protein DL96DRAFT_1671996 [Flagelloscypha sp. PMI_526]
MEYLRGLDRSSYIFGKSVHNIRIECLWYDVTRGFGAKWKQFFYALELHHDFDPDNSAHLWLLHFLFLDSIDRDAQEWQETWNSHRLRLQHERDRSPRDLFIFGMVENGIRGFELGTEPVNEDVEDPESYGVDWQDLQNPTLLAHHQEQNPMNAEQENNPFGSVTSHLPAVEVVPPNCPLRLEDVNTMNQTLEREFGHRGTRNMDIRRQVWVRALEICNTLGIANRRRA